MAILYNPTTGYYSDGTEPPVDPSTGKPLDLPPNTKWENGGYVTIKPGEPGYVDPNPPKTPPSTTTTTPPPKEDFSAFLTDLQNKYNVPYTENDSPIDLARLKEYQAGIDRFRALQADPNTDWEKESAKGAISFPSQLEDFKKALEAQYKQRGANTNGPDDGTSSSGYVPPNTSNTSGGGGSTQQTQTAGNYAQMFGAPPAPFSETYQQVVRPSWLQGEFQAPARPAYLQGEYHAPARPEYLQTPYVAPTWTDKFVAPSVADLQNEPGYLARLDAAQRGFERSAAAKGSVLSGGFVGRTLPRELQTQASNEYANVYGRAFDTYNQRYGQFQDMATRDAAARQFNENAYNADVTNAYNTRNVNENAYNTDVGNAFNARGANESAYATDVTNNLNAYKTRYQAYQDLIANNRNTELDWWARQRDIGQFGLDASLGGRPPVYT